MYKSKNMHSMLICFLRCDFVFYRMVGFYIRSADEMNNIAINVFVASIISAACGFFILGSAWVHP